jgi:hypothetical protein
MGKQLDAPSPKDSGDKALKEVRELKKSIVKEKEGIEQSQYAGITFGSFFVALGVYYSINLIEGNSSLDIPLLGSIVQLLWLIIYACGVGFVYGLYGLIKGHVKDKKSI